MHTSLIRFYLWAQGCLWKSYCSLQVSVSASNELQLAPFDLGGNHVVCQVTTELSRLSTIWQLITCDVTERLHFIPQLLVYRSLQQQEKKDMCVSVFSGNTCVHVNLGGPWQVVANCLDQLLILDCQVWDTPASISDVASQLIITEMAQEKDRAATE